MSIHEMIYDECIHNTDLIADRLGLSDEERTQLRDISSRYPVCVTPYYLDLIDPDDPEDPIRKMCIPDVMEYCDEGQEDTSGEAQNTVVTGMQHKYAPTALILSTNQCAMYCRHCFRKRMVGANMDEIVSDIPAIAAYVQDHPEIDNVLISGGDAFMNSDQVLETYLETFLSIPSIRYVRFGTRIPAVMPSRITEDPMLKILLSEYGRTRQIVIVTQFNHPREVTPEARKAVNYLKECGCIIRNQAVLLQGVNDDPEVLAELMEKLVSAGVIPYYVFQCRPVKGVRNQFQVPILKGIEIIDEAKSYMSGQGKCFRYAMSHPMGKLEILGKVPGQGVLFKFHQAKYDKDQSRIFFMDIAEDQTWLPPRT